jgi:MFS family permease
MTGWHHTELIGLVILIWAAGSIIGGLIFGALHSRPGRTELLLGLAGTLAVTTLAQTVAVYALLLGLNGLFVAPTYAAISAELTASVLPRQRAEALAWQSGAMVLGGALGALAAGLVIDSWGWPAGLLMPATVALGTVLAQAGLHLGSPSLRRSGSDLSATPASTCTA